MSSSTALEIVRLGRSWRDALARFLLAIENSEEAAWFRPHPFTPEVIERLSAQSGKDLYYLLVEGDEVLGYGMLRGWDEGYDVPSLGIAIHPGARGKGLGRLFMQVLHGAAKRRGATRVRLRVHPENASARRLYEALGYKFEATGSDLPVGVLDLGPP